MTSTQNVQDVDGGRKRTLHPLVIVAIVVVVAVVVLPVLLILAISFLGTSSGSEFTNVGSSLG